jgi:hypothetical protein
MSMTFFMNVLRQILKGGYIIGSWVPQLFRFKMVQVSARMELP